MKNPLLDYALLGVLAFLWGSSYMWIGLAVDAIPPFTLIAFRVLLAFAVLVPFMALAGTRLPRESSVWRSLFFQSLMNTTGPWVLLAWGQQYTDSAVSSVLNSTSPLWVFALSILLASRSDLPGFRQLAGALAGFAGVVVIVGAGALADLGDNLLPQLAVLLSAILYGAAALRGRRFAHLPPIVPTAAMLLCSAVTLVPLSLLIDRPWSLRPDVNDMAAVTMLAVFCTALAFLIYFRLLGTLGAMGTASQAYLRSGVGVFLGVVFLSETLDFATAAGIGLAIFGVVLINWPSKSATVKSDADTEKLGEETP